MARQLCNVQLPRFYSAMCNSHDFTFIVPFSSVQFPQFYSHSTTPTYYVILSPSHILIFLFQIFSLSPL